VINNIVFVCKEVQDCPPELRVISFFRHIICVCQYPMVQGIYSELMIMS